MLPPSSLLALIIPHTRTSCHHYYFFLLCIIINHANFFLFLKKLYHETKTIKNIWFFFFFPIRNLTIFLALPLLVYHIGSYTYYVWIVCRVNNGQRHHLPAKMTRKCVWHLWWSSTSRWHTEYADLFLAIVIIIIRRVSGT